MTGEFDVCVCHAMTSKLSYMHEMTSWIDFVDAWNQNKWAIGILFNQSASPSEMEVAQFDEMGMKSLSSKD